MARLYFRIYLAVLGSLALFAILAGITWRLTSDGERFGPRREFYTKVLERLAPEANTPIEEQRRLLSEWRDRSGYDMALFAADGSVIAESGGSEFATLPHHYRLHSDRWLRRAWMYRAELADGRTLVALRPPAERSEIRRFAPLLILLGIGIAVAIAAFPVVRRLTRRLETLQTGVAALGAGDLTARVKVEGKDEVARLAETFNGAAERIQSLVTANKSLLANASHELRSPLARLRMGLETLPPETPTATKDEIIRNIHELDRLIDEILLASRLDAKGEAAMNREDVDLVGLIAEECAVTDARLELASVDLPLVQGDPRLLRRMFRNLLQNAERYGGGAAEVTVSQSGKDVLIDVADRGPGVPKSERERIFEPFYRLSGAREKDGGVGLGLALVREIATRHDGTVTCLPRPNGGSIFRTTLKRA